MGATATKHWAVTVKPANGGEQETFWINSSNRAYAVHKALRLCGFGAILVEMTSLDAIRPQTNGVRSLALHDTARA